MKALASIVFSAGILATQADAEVVLSVDGKKYPLSVLMEHCQSMGDNPTGQIACFQAVSALVNEQTKEQPATVAGPSAPEALEALRALAEFEDDQAGLLIQGNECSVQITYFANYFHVSRRNVSSLDLFSARFDASDIVVDQTIRDLNGQTLVAQAVLGPGATATTFGSMAVESTQYNFAPKSAAMTVGDYAMEVAEVLGEAQSNQFDFVLVHPAKRQSSAEIWTAFEAYVAACQR